MLSDYYAIRRLRLYVAGLGFALACTVVLLLTGWFLAKQPLSTDYNLYYLMWKKGLRGYDSEVALSGMFHDREFCQSLLGITVSEFEARFPSTFYEVRKLPPVAKEGQRFFIDSYEQSKREDGSIGMGWLAVFESGKLIEFEFSK